MDKSWKCAFKHTLARYTECDTHLYLSEISRLSKKTSALNQRNDTTERNTIQMAC